MLAKWLRLGLAFLAFLGRQPKGALEGPAKRTWKGQVRGDLARLADDDLDRFAAIWRRRYEELEDARLSASARAGSLFVFMGLIATATTFVAGSFAKSSGPPPPVIVAAAIVLGYFAVGAATLAVRSQLVGTWDIPRVSLEDATSARGIRLTNAVEVYISAEQNKHRLRNVIACLRDGQLYALISLFLLTSIVIIAVMAPPRGPTAGAGSGSPLPSRVTPSASLTPSSSIASS
jgi:hypothetical protein